MCEWCKLHLLREVHFLNCGTCNWTVFSIIDTKVFLSLVGHLLMSPFEMFALFSVLFSALNCL